MKKRSLLMILALALSLTLAIGGTLAYLQDTDADVNVMTLGSVYIVQNEQERLPDGTLDAFKPNKPAYPAVGPIEWATTGVDVNGTEYKVFTDDLKNVIDKIVTVTNTGKSDAYVRTIIAIEAPEGDPKDLIHINYNGDDVLSWGEGLMIKIDGVDYYCMVATYNDALKAGETSAPSLMQLFLDSKATNEDVAKFGDTWEVLVLSQAMQSDGFKNAATALNTGFGEATAKNVAEWFGGWETWEEGEEIGSPNGKLPEGWDDNNPPPADAVRVSTADELIAALEAGKDVLLTKDIKIDPASMSNAYGTTGINVKNGQAIYGNGYTIDIKGAGGTWDSGINTTGGLIKDLTVTGSFRGIFINHNSSHTEQVVLDKVTTTNTTYTISCDQGTGKGLLATDSTFNGWTSYAATLGDAKFVNCSFNEGNGYAYCRAYAPTEFVGCDFQAGYTLDPRAAVTLENCTIGGKPLTAENLTTLVTNTANATVK